MTNPYVENLIEMGYDRADCETVAVAGLDKTFPMNIHGRVYQTQEEYDEALHDFLNGMWNIPSLSECSGAPIFLSFININTMSTTSFCNGQSWSKSDAYYHTENSDGCWEDYLSPDEYEDVLDRKRYEQSMRRTAWWSEGGSHKVSQ